MTVKELNIGDVFRVAGEEQLWRKAGQAVFRRVGGDLWYLSADPSEFTGKRIEIVERADVSEIRRSEDTLILKGGEVTLQYHGPWLIHRCTPGDPFTEFVLSGSSFGASRGKRPTEDTALAFMVGSGAKHLNRGKGSDLFAYKGRVYARATNKEVRGKVKAGGYSLLRKVDGARRLVIAGVLNLPGEFALYDIIMEHFGPDTVPQTGAE